MGNDKKPSGLKEYNAKLKRHLSNDYVRLSEKRTELECELAQFKVDKDRRDKKLFQTVGQVNLRRYFSPLNIDDSFGKSNDEKLEQLKSNMSRIESEIRNISANMIEIQEILKGADFYLGYKERRYQQNQKIEEEKKSSEYKKKLETQLVDTHLENNLKELIRVYQEQYKNFEISLDFDGNNVALEEKLCKNLLIQIVNTLNFAIEECHVKNVAMQGEISTQKVHLTIRYMCDEEIENTVVFTIPLASKEIVMRSGLQKLFRVQK